MYYEITEDANLDAFEVIVNGPLFEEDEDYSYITLYTQEETK